MHASDLADLRANANELSRVRGGLLTQKRVLDRFADEEYAAHRPRRARHDDDVTRDLYEIFTRAR